MTLVTRSITPAATRRENLPRLAASLVAQREPAAALARSSTTAPGTARPSSREELAQEHAWIRLLSVEGAAAAERGAPDRPCAPRRRSRSCRRPARLRRQRRRRHLLRARLLRAAAGSLRSRSGSRDRERERLRAPGGRLAPAARDRHDGLGRVARLPLGLPAGDPALRGAGRPGTASTSSRPTRAAGARWPSRPGPSSTSPRGRARRRWAGATEPGSMPRTTSATAPGISSCARSSTHARSPPPWG